MRRVLIHAATMLTAVAAAFALFWTVQTVARPYGLDAVALTSDSTYFDWNPLDTIPGLPHTVALGQVHRITYRLPEYQPWMESLARWTDQIMGDAPSTLARVDSLLFWWHRRFADYPTVGKAFPGIVPIDTLVTSLAPPKSPTLCTPQALAFQILLTSQRMPVRQAFLNSRLGAPDYNGHAVVEVWVPELQKWVLVDPMLGVRYTLHGEPLSLREMAELRREGRLDEVSVEYLGRREPFPKHRFDTTYLTTDTVSAFFNTPGVWYNSEMLQGERPLIKPTRYYLGWSASAGPFDPVPAEVRKLRLRIARAVLAWIVVVFGVWVTIRLRKGRSTSGA